MRVFFRTLGCPKNTADSGRLIGFLSRYGISPADSETAADAVVINTCSFIRTATEESLSEIFAAVKLNRRIIVTGCLPARYGAELKRRIPEVEAFVPITDLERFPEVLLGRKTRPSRTEGHLPVLTAASTCYVKISEGCDRRCSFCVIPSIRGRQVSRPAAEIETEVRRRAESGVREIVLVGQDLTAYGRDTGSGLQPLLERLLKVRGDFVFRLLYLYPPDLTSRLIDFILAAERICPYFDIPFQHSSRKILAAMRRSFDSRKLLG